MSDNPARTDETITLLKIQALLASAYELSRQAGGTLPITMLLEQGPDLRWRATALEFVD